MPEPVTGPYNPPCEPTDNTPAFAGSTATGQEATKARTADTQIAETQRGRFTILKEHARGGLGMVSLARDDKLGRQVALKEIRPEHGANPEFRQRFVTEAAITGMLEHPGIVPIYQMDEDADGRPFYAMRFIQGHTLAEAIRQFHRNRQGDGASSSLEFRSLLQRFASVCQTIAYAHSKGVIHRDLKPANVMLGDYGETLVVDWGLAKQLGVSENESSSDRAGIFSPATHGLTQAGQVLGTPAYMAPEQATGDSARVCPATDIYALGAMLYELLTDRPPFHDPVPGLILYKVAHGEFAPPRRIVSAVPSPLEAICLKAMALRVEDRYASAGAFGQDVERWLADEPVNVYREPLATRARRWARRHRVLVSSAAVLLITAVVGLSLGLAAVENERRNTAEERDQKGLALQAETRAKLAATAARNRTMKALRKLTDDLVAQQLAGHLQLTDDDRQFLRDIQRQYEEFADLPGEDVEQREIRGEGLFRVALMRHHLGEQKEAEAGYVSALQLYRRLAHDFPDHWEFRKALGMTLVQFGQLLNSTGRPQDAEAAFMEALKLFQQLAAAHPRMPEVLQELAVSHESLARLLQATGRLPQAEKEFAAGLAVEKQLAGDFPDQPKFRHALARSQVGLGAVLHNTGRFTEAETAYRDAIALQTQLVAKFPGRAEYRLQLALSSSNLAVLLQFTGQTQAAEESYLHAIALRKKLAADFPAQPNFRDDLAKSHRNLGHLLNATGRTSDAEATYGSALTLHKQLATDFPAQPDYRRELGADHLHLGNLFWGTGRLKDAESAYLDSVALYKQLVADFPTRPEFGHELAMGQGNLGMLLKNMGRTQDAEAAFTEALTLYRRLAADFPNRPEFRQGLGRIHSELAPLLAATRRLKDAEAAYLEAIRERKQLTLDFPTRSDFRQDLATSQNDLGSLLADLGRFQEAEATYAEALALRRQLAADFPNMPDNHNFLAGTLVNMAGMCVRTADYSRARTLLAEALPHHQKALQTNPKHPTYRQFYRVHLNTLVHCCAGIDDQTAALEAAQKLRDLGWNRAGDAYDAACALARCIAQVEKDKRGTKEERASQLRFYADQAMAMLRDAAAKGFKNAAHMKKDTDLDPLRQREDFQKLLAELEVKEK
jgi:serine/threonine-protein kinase